MNKETEQKFKEAAKEILAEKCSKDKNGDFYVEIYADYRDEINKETLKKISRSDDPRSTFYDWLFEAYEQVEWEYEDEVIRAVLEDEKIKDILSVRAKDHDERTECVITDSDEEEARENLRDMFYVQYPEDHFLNQDMLIDVIVDTGDANYDYICNNFGPHYDTLFSKNETISEDASILWLARQQGYTKNELNAAMKERPSKDKKFLFSVYQEIENASTCMNALVFMVRMTLKKFFELHDAIAKEKDLNKSHYRQNRKGRGWITLDKRTCTGLYDAWNGSGGCLDIILEKDVRLPIR